MTGTDTSQPSHSPIFNLGFRIFFAAASIFSVMSISLWLIVYAGFMSLPVSTISVFQWHAHEMIYGYTLAVIAGFLLTAVRNWTGLPTPQGKPLKQLFFIWLLARVFNSLVIWIFPTLALAFAAIFDLVFITLFGFAIAKPIFQKKQWRQMAVLSKIFLIAAGNIAFYAQALGFSDNSAYLSVYAGVYIVVGLILTIGRRIIPPFTERGVPYSVTLYNAKWLDLSSMLVFLAFFISALFYPETTASHYFAAIMIIITAIRMIGWYTVGIWQSPLLWCFFASLASIVIGFFLHLVQGALGLSPYLSIHAFAFGTIGIMTMGMMGRVSIGHTGRNIKAPPKQLNLSLLLLTLGAVIRVLLPAIMPSSTYVWVHISGLLWIAAFVLFVHYFYQIWTSPRPDGKYG